MYKREWKLEDRRKMKNLQIDGSTGLVLEGGGMRGVFTCGVLDYFMDHDIRFPYAIGVSAGACNGLSYASRQRGRAKYSNIDLLEKYNYIGLKYLLKSVIFWISIYCSMSSPNTFFLMIMKHILLHRNVS